MTPGRTDDRITKRFDVVFHIGDSTFEGTTSNLSRSGLFVRTNHCFKAGAKIRLELSVDEEIIFLEGFVRRANLTRLGVGKNGMGVELDNPGADYLALVRDLEM